MSADESGTTLASVCTRSRREQARRLNGDERLLYEWVLRRFATGAQVDADALAAAAADYEVDAEQVLATLTREDLVHRDPATGAILVAYPFSAAPRGHRVLIDGEHWVEAMCAIDALGIAAMLKLPVEIVSPDPISGGEVWVRIDPGDGAWWEPAAAVVLTASGCCAGPSFRSCCDLLNFFESGENADRYLAAHPEITGQAISLPQAIEAGETVFGGVLGEA